MEQVRLSESPSRKIPDGGTIRTVGATVEERYKERFTCWEKILHENKTDQQSEQKIEKQEMEQEKKGGGQQTGDKNGEWKKVIKWQKEESLTSVSTATNPQSNGWDTCYHKRSIALPAAVLHLLP